MTRSQQSQLSLVTTAPSSPLRLPSTWVRWLLDQARLRGQQVQGVLRSSDGACQLCGAELVWSLSEPHPQWQITQKPGIKGLHTHLEVQHHGEVTAALLADRGPGCAEPPSWRVLVMEALVLASKSA
jgi:hypothetical protein